MILSQLILQHFRNFSNHSFDFNREITLILGENARGKTSLLEAIYFIIFGTGFRETREIELLQWHESIGIVQGIFEVGEDRELFQIKLDEEEENRVNKSYFVSKTEKSLYAYRKLQSYAVLFAPQHINIITGSPSRRRKYIDTILAATDATYRKHLNNYTTALRKRNKVLEFAQGYQQLDEEIEFWNNYLSEQAAYITKKRQAYIDYLNIHPDIQNKQFSIRYIKDEFTAERVKEKSEKERRVRKTLIGPQKDDYQIFLHSPEKKDVSLYGSRSEQRMAVFWLKLNEINFVEEKLQKKPLLLLDDVFSELDDHNKEVIIKTIPRYQTIITSTEDDIQELTNFSKSIIEL